MPSSTDEETFRRVFGPCDWSVMAIVARGGESYARLRFNAGPGGQVPIAMEVDWERFAQEVIDLDGQMNEVFTAWQDEYGQNIFEQVWAMEPSPALQA
ncbi:MAG: hypothetical protein K8T91_27160, partial [Planctomycetes bacterium]|nr:hypothetical protein [Planctomycetota bacterium]